LALNQIGISRFEDEPHFIVGIVEPEERVHIPLPARIGVIMEESVADIAVRPPCVQVASTSNTLMTEERYPIDASGHMSVQFSALYFKIVVCSDAFAAFFGPCVVGANLSKWLDKKRNREFYSSFQKLCNSFAYGCTGESDCTLQCKWVVQNHHCGLVDVDIDITLRRVMPSGDGSKNSASFMSDDDPDDPVMVIAEAVLSNIVQRSASIPSTRSSRSSGSGGRPKGTRGNLVPTTIGQMMSI